MKKNSNLNYANYANISNKKFSKKNNNKKIMINNDNIKNTHRISTMKSSPNISNSLRNLNMDINENIKIDNNNNNTMNIQKHSELKLNNNYLKSNKNQNLNNFLNNKIVISNQSLKNINKRKFIDDLKYLNDNNINYFPKFFLPLKITKKRSYDNLSKNYLFKSNIPKNNNKKNDSIKDENNSLDLSEIAGEIVNKFQLPKKLEHCNSYNNHQNTKKLILSKAIKKNSQIKNDYKNYTFKTIFVNNFCVVPINSSFINQNISHGNLNNDKNNNYSNTSSNENNKIIKDNFINYQSAINIKETTKLRKNNSHKMNIYKNNNKKLNLRNNGSDLYLINKNKKLDRKNNLTENNNNFFKKRNILNNGQTALNNIISKDNNFNEDYYYTTMDFSKLNSLQKKKINSAEININDKNKRHIKFDLSQNILFTYKEKDYISKYIKYFNSKKVGNKKLIPKNIKPIIKKFNIKDIKTNKNYVLKENLEEIEIIISDVIEHIDDNNI